MLLIVRKTIIIKGKMSKEHDVKAAGRRDRLLWTTDMNKTEHRPHKTPLTSSFICFIIKTTYKMQFNSYNLVRC